VKKINQETESYYFQYIEEFWEWFSSTRPFSNGCHHFFLQSRNHNADDTLLWIFSNNSPLTPNAQLQGTQTSVLFIILRSLLGATIGDFMLVHTAWLVVGSLAIFILFGVY